MKKILIIPASGLGLRMSSDVPKQYIKLDNGLTILDTTLSRLLVDDFFDLVVVVIAKKDRLWYGSKYKHHPKIRLCYGGDERFNSVKNALTLIKPMVQDTDWVFVHDAARPCIHINDVKRLFLGVVQKNGVGGLLAAPVVDTVKEIDAHRLAVLRTLDRDHIYLAQTPQMFRYRTLSMAYYFCEEHNIQVTDEASAVESLDHQPIVISNSKYNMKVTTPEDVNLVNYILLKEIKNKKSI